MPEPCKVPAISLDVGIADVYKVLDHFFANKFHEVRELVLPQLLHASHLTKGRTTIQALSAHSAAEFNSSPGRWQHVWLVAIVPPERWGKTDINDCHTTWGSFKTLISLLHHS
jgi:hypothetical protein